MAIDAESFLLEVKKWCKMVPIAESLYFLQIIYSYYKNKILNLQNIWVY